MEAFLRVYMDPDALESQYSCRSQALAGRGCGTLNGELISTLGFGDTRLERHARLMTYRRDRERHLEDQID